jgi:hypothetical protein
MTRRLSEPPMLDFWATRNALFNISSFVGARMLQLPDAAAIAIQLGAAALGVAAVWFAFRYHSASAARMAVLTAATLLASPYSIHYDLMLLLPAALVLYRQGAATGFHPLEPLIYPVLWLMPIAILWFNYRLPLPITPLVVLTFGFIALMRLRADRRDAIGA